MKSKPLLSTLLVAAVALPASATANAPGAEATSPIVTLCGLAALGGCMAVLLLLTRAPGDARARPWRLSDALSEDVVYTDASGRGVTLLTASSSRLIAMLGMVVSLPLVAGIGLLLLKAVASGAAVPAAVDSMQKYLIGSAGLFLPYLANQLRAGLERKVSGLVLSPSAGDLPVPGQKPVMGTLVPGPRT